MTGPSIENILGLPLHEARAALAAGEAGLRLTDERHGGSGSSLFAADAAGVEHVFHQPTRGRLQHWRWPSDPAIPDLAGAVRRWPGAVRLAYKPLRRATFRAEGRDGPIAVKVGVPGDVARARRAVAVGALAAATGAFRAPRLIASRPDEVVIVWLPGVPVDRLADGDVDAVATAALEAVAAIASTQADQPHYELGGDLAKLRRLAALAAEVDPELATDATVAAVRLEARIAPRLRDYALTHGDLTPRNMVWDASQDVPLGILDWDHAEIGPPERDLAWIADLGVVVGRTLATRDACGSAHRVDQELVDAFAELKAVTRTIRRAALGKPLRADARAAVRRV